MRNVWMMAMLSIGAGAFAQENCCKPPAFPFDELPLATYKLGHGNADFEISTENDSSQVYFNQGMDMFFSFNDHEAYMAFNKAYLLDTLCFTCRVARFMMIEEIDENVPAFFTEINALLPVWNEQYYDNTYKSQEVSFIKLVLDSYFEKKRKNIRPAYEQAAENLVEEHSTWPLAYAFYLKVQADNLDAFGNPTPRMKKAIKRADRHMEKKEGVNHYQRFSSNAAFLHLYIHLYETWKPEKVKPYADKIAELGPNSGHLVHMPGHVHFYNGEYHKAIAAFEQSNEVDSVYNARNAYGKMFNWNKIHNQHFLGHVLAETGQLKAAEKNYKKSIKDYANLHPEMTSAGMWQVVLNDVQTAWRLSRWQEAKDLLHNHAVAYEENGRMLYLCDGLTIFFDAMQALEYDNPDTLVLFKKQMTKHLKSAKSYRKKGGVVLKSKYWSEYAVLQKLDGLLGFAANQSEGVFPDFDIQFSFLQQRDYTLHLGDPPFMMWTMEEYAAFVLEKHMAYAQATRYLESALYKMPNSGIICLKLARMYFKSGNKEKAQTYLNKFSQAWAKADKGLVEWEKARVLQLQLDK